MTEEPERLAHQEDVLRRMAEYKAQNGGGPSAPPDAASAEPAVVPTPVAPRPVAQDDSDPAAPSRKSTPQEPAGPGSKSTSYPVSRAENAAGSSSKFGAGAWLGWGSLLFALVVATPSWGWAVASLAVTYVARSRVKRDENKGRKLASARGATTFALVIGWAKLLLAVIVLVVSGVSNAAAQNAAESATAEEVAAETPVPALQWMADEYCAGADHVLFEGGTASFEVVVCSDDSGTELTYVGGNDEFGYLALPAHDAGGYWAAANESVSYGVSETALSAVDIATDTYIVDESMEWSNRYD